MKNIIKKSGKILKVVLEIAVLIFLIFTIVNLLNSEDGIMANTGYSLAQEKLNTAIKIFSSTDGLTLEDAINDIEGLESLEIKEGGLYEIKIDGYDFLVVSQEILNGGEPIIAQEGNNIVEKNEAIIEE